jgi:hypothetical protein
LVDLEGKQNSLKKSEKILLEFMWRVWYRDRNHVEELLRLSALKLSLLAQLPFSLAHALLSHSGVSILGYQNLVPSSYNYYIEKRAYVLLYRTDQNLKWSPELLQFFLSEPKKLGKDSNLVT